MHLNVTRTETQISVNLKILNFELRFILNRKVNKELNTKDYERSN